MKLAYSAASPYVRKVMILAHECGLADRIEKVPTAVRPDQPNIAYGSTNPLMKVPALTTDGGEVLFDSRVICAYLDTLHSGRKLIPETGGARWKALRLEAFGDGMTDAALLVRYETFLRPENLRWKEWIDGQSLKVTQALDQLESEPDQLAGDVTIGHIAVAAGLGWISFRNIVDAFAGRPKLKAWFEKMSERPSLKATAPAA
ncbi:MAG: glutathione S-transferase [Alphaproteobacteria bacterium]|nr:glutathione S-transferase [Alphaproteobacteria bacterium]